MRPPVPLLDVRDGLRLPVNPAACRAAPSPVCAWRFRSLDIDSTLLLVLVPLVLIQVGLVIWGLFDLTRPERRVKGGSKVLWAVVIILLNIVGPLIYFLFGREEA